MSRIEGRGFCSEIAPTAPRRQTFSKPSPTHELSQPGRILSFIPLYWQLSRSVMESRARGTVPVYVAG